MKKKDVDLNYSKNQRNMRRRSGHRSHSHVIVDYLPKDEVAFDEIANRVVAPNIAVEALAREFLVILAGKKRRKNAERSCPKFRRKPFYYCTNVGGQPSSNLPSAPPEC